MQLRRPAALAATFALMLSGCAVTDAGTGASEQPGATASSPAIVEKVRASGVQPCTKLPRAEGRADEAGEVLPALSLPCLTGGPAVDLSRLGGRPVVVNLWATWCGPCREEMPVLQAAHERYGDRVSLVGVDTKDDPHRAGAFLEDVGVTYPQLVDLDGRLLAHLGIPGLPVTVVLDAAGRVTSRHVGPVTAESLDELVRLAE